MNRSYFLVPANFLAAIGGGIIISAGINEGTILAFFIGAVMGFSLSRFLPKHWVKVIAPWLSLTVGVISLLLLASFEIYDVKEPLTGIARVIFICVLSLRFGLSFFSRAWRSQIVGSEPQGVALIELGYYTGMGVGLLVWGIRGLFTALLVDAALQTIAGLIDLGSMRKRRPLQTKEQEENPASGATDEETVDKIPFDYQLYRRIALAIVCLTVGFQAVSFSLSGWDLGPGKTRILACFYVGVALAALVCRVFKISLTWQTFDRKLAGNATISPGTTKPLLDISFGMITLIAALSMIAVLLGIRVWEKATLIVLIFISISAFVYQILVISLLDQISRAEKLADSDSMLLRTYLIVAVVTIISIEILSRFPSHNYTCMMLTLVCSVIAFSAVRKREIVPA